MIFWRIVDNQLHPVQETDNLGFEESEGLRIPDEYLDTREFVVMRTAHGIGDWGIISAMPRLLKEKYSNCKVYLPSSKLLKKLFSEYEKNWSTWNAPFENVNTIFDNNPYVDGYKDDVEGEIFHDHYRIYDKDNVDIPLVEQILKFWQFGDYEYKDSQPEIYWSKEERELGDGIIREYVGDREFGCLLVSNRIGTQFGKHIEENYKSEVKKIKDILLKNKLSYFYWIYKPIEYTPFNFIDTALDIRNINFRIQMYIRCKAVLNIGNQSGALQLSTRYSSTYDIQRQFPIGHNFVRGEVCI